jgi:hypothetical protein
MALRTSSILWIVLHPPAQTPEASIAIAQTTKPVRAQVSRLVPSWRLHVEDAGGDELLQRVARPNTLALVTGIRHLLSGGKPLASEAGVASHERSEDCR